MKTPCPARARKRDPYFAADGENYLLLNSLVGFRKGTRRAITLPITYTNFPRYRLCLRNYQSALGHNYHKKRTHTCVQYTLASRSRAVQTTESSSNMTAKRCTKATYPLYISAKRCEALGLSPQSRVHASQRRYGPFFIKLQNSFRNRLPQTVEPTLLW